MGPIQHRPQSTPRSRGRLKLHILKTIPQEEERVARYIPSLGRVKTVFEPLVDQSIKGSNKKAVRMMNIATHINPGKEYPFQSDRQRERYARQSAK